MDTAQLVLLFVVVVLTILLVVLGVQVFFILRELRRTVSKANKVLDETTVIAESVSGRIASFSTILSGIKVGTSFAKLFQKRKSFLSKIFTDDTSDEDGKE